MTLFKQTLDAKRERALAVYERLSALYPEATCSLTHRSPLQLLVATILAAQCTDARVNIVTITLFKRFKTPKDYVDAPRAELEEAIRTCGFYHQKAKFIANASQRIIDVYGGQVPNTMEDLVTLEGVGRKTANCVLGQCFGVPSVIVDTHCIRLGNRIGFTKSMDPVVIERDLMKIWPRDVWTPFSHCMVFHGRAVCHARLPRCCECAIRDLCPYGSRRAER